MAFKANMAKQAVEEQNKTVIKDQQDSELQNTHTIETSQTVQKSETSLVSLQNKPSMPQDQKDQKDQKALSSPSIFGRSVNNVLKSSSENSKEPEKYPEKIAEKNRETTSETKNSNTSPLINPSESFDTTKLFKIINAVGLHNKMSPQEISSVKKRCLSPIEAKKVYAEYVEILNKIQIENQQEKKPLQNAASNQSSANKPDNINTNETYEFKYLKAGKLQVIKRSKNQFPEFEYYDGCTVEFIPKSDTIFANQSVSKKLKP